jgi:hypothetical protein
MTREHPDFEQSTLYEAGQTSSVHVSPGGIVMAERNLSPLPTVTLNNLMLDPSKMRFLGLKSTIGGDLLAQEIGEIRRF